MHFRPSSNSFEIEYCKRTLKDIRRVTLPGEAVRFTFGSPDDYIRMEFTDADDKRRRVRLIGLFLNKPLVKVLAEPVVAARIRELAQSMGKWQA